MNPAGRDGLIIGNMVSCYVPCEESPLTQNIYDKLQVVKARLRVRGPGTLRSTEALHKTAANRA